MPTEPVPAVPSYTATGALQLPERYREWVYLSTGLDMSYRPSSEAGQHSFENVFVNPESYRAFRESGRWPDRTILVLESRGAREQGSINRSGHYQSEAIMDLEVHLKDERRFRGGWAFFAFAGKQTGTLLPPGADCYSCHAAHAAVDTTFVQFYPTLLPIATRKGTLSNGYRADEAARQR